MDAYPESGGKNGGPTPVEAFISAGAPCSAIDILLILEKKRQKVTSYHI
jgi:putative redox protein